MHFKRRFRAVWGVGTIWRFPRPIIWRGL